jgi:hypothetical protein
MVDESMHTGTYAVDRAPDRFNDLGKRTVEVDARTEHQVRAQRLLGQLVKEEKVLKDRTSEPRRGIAPDAGLLRPPGRTTDPGPEPETRGKSRPLAGLEDLAPARLNRASRELPVWLFHAQR